MPSARPLNLIDGITAPVILFQGLDDKVVPPEQSRLIVDKLKQRGIDVDYHEFAGEGHGFRKAETIIAVLEAELAFLQRVPLTLCPASGRDGRDDGQPRTQRAHFVAARSARKTWGEGSSADPSASSLTPAAPISAARSRE